VVTRLEENAEFAILAALSCRRVLHCVNGFRVDFGHNWAPFILVVVVALFMIPFLFQKFPKFCDQICGLSLRVRD